MLTKEQTEQLVKLLTKIKHPKKDLPADLFDVLVQVVPFCACELIIANPKGELLLTYRDDKFWRGWHFPGGLLRYGDTFDYRLKEVARKELGTKLKSYKFLFPMNYNQTPRGHVVSLVFLCITKDKCKDGRFFKRMPRDIIRSHREVWQKVKKILNK